MPDRTDENGAAYPGSQLQTQIYVNRRTEQLNAALAAEFPGLDAETIEWRSPLESDRYAEYFGGAFLDRVDLGEHRASLASFWPARGPQWDALAVVDPGSSRPGVILVEGKSHTDEMLAGSPCESPPHTVNRQKIEGALKSTRERLGVSHEHAAAWTGPLYQNANRLAHLGWLSSLGVRANLAYLLFVDDPRSPTTASQWHAALEKANLALGLDGSTIEGVGHVLLGAGARDELVG